MNRGRDNSEARELECWGRLGREIESELFKDVKFKVCRAWMVERRLVLQHRPNSPKSSCLEWVGPS